MTFKFKPGDLIQDHINPSLLVLILETMPEGYNSVHQYAYKAFFSDSKEVEIFNQYYIERNYTKIA